MAEGEAPAEPQVPAAPETLPWFTTCSWPPYHYKLYERVYKLIKQKGLFYNSAEARKQPPYKFKTPEQLRQEVDFSLGEKGVDHDTLIDYFEKLIDYSPHRSHPFFLHKDGTGLDPYAIVGDFTANILSTAVLTYLFAPVFTLQEEILETNLRRILGYPNPEEGDGVQTPGGGFASCMAIAAALNYTFPDIREKGFGQLDEPNIAVFASEYCNEFVEKACFVAGLGQDSLVKVRTDQQGRMNVAQLKQQIERSKSKGVQPLMVIATIGTDPLGAIDPIPEIAQICEDNNIWFHVDGTYGGPLLLSDKFRKGKLAGVEKSKTFILGGSGMLGMPWCSTTMVTPIPDHFFKSFGVGAEVVFEPTLLYDSLYDNGDHTIQTSRRGDISKFWLLWKTKGRNGIVRHLDYVLDLATQFNEEIKRRPAFHAVIPELDCTRVVFYYIPRTLRYLPRSMDYMSYQMTNVSRKIKNKLLSKGSVFLSLSKIKAYPECFAVSITNSATTLDDLKYVLDEIEAAGKETSGKLLYNPWLPPPPLDSESTLALQNESKAEAVGFQEAEGESQPYSSPPPPRDTFPNYVNSAVTPLHQRLFDRVTELIDAKGLYFQDKREEPLLCFRDPDELQQEFDLTLSDEPSLNSEDQVIESMTKMIRYSIHQSHPFYIYQLLSGGLDPYTIMADFMLTVMTSSGLTYEDSPFYTLVEEEVMRASRKIIGYPENGDGMLCPGGSVANETAITVARLLMFPETKQRGLDGWKQIKPTLYVSKNAHYCFQKGALLNGIGLENVVSVAPDSDGRMDIGELRKEIAKTKANGGTPFFVGGTGGTTVLGVFDNIGEIAKVCKENNMYFHIDGSVGGASMFSERRLKDKLKYSHLADSFSFNPHKWYGVTQETAIMLFKQGGVLKQTLGLSSSQQRRGGGKGSSRWFNWFYKHHSSHKDESRNYDSTSAYGDLAAHAGISWERRANILKFWLVWKSKGIEGLGDHIEYTYDNKEFLVNELKRPERQEMFKLVKPDFECPGVCFYYLPLAIRNMNADKNSEEYKNALEQVPLPLQARLVRADVTITPVFRDNDSPLFTKFTILSSGINRNDITYLLDAIDYHGRDLPIQ